MTIRSCPFGLRAVACFTTAGLAALWSAVVSAVACDIQIGSIDRLLSIGKRANIPLSGSYCLTRDISAAGRTVEPIGDENNLFTGQFDGQGYTVDGLNISP